MSGDPVPLDPDRPEVDDTVSGQRRQRRLCFRPRQQHGVAKMRPASRMRQHMTEQQRLIGLNAPLVFQRTRLFLRERCKVGNQPWIGVGGVKDKLLDPDEPAEVTGQPSVDRFDVVAEELDAKSGREAAMPWPLSPA